MKLHAAISFFFIYFLIGFQRDIADEEICFSPHWKLYGDYIVPIVKIESLNQHKNYYPHQSDTDKLTLTIFKPKLTELWNNLSTTTTTTTTTTTMSESQMDIVNIDNDNNEKENSPSPPPPPNAPPPQAPPPHAPPPHAPKIIPFENHVISEKSDLVFETMVQHLGIIEMSKMPMSSPSRNQKSSSRSSSSSSKYNKVSNMEFLIQNIKEDRMPLLKFPSDLLKFSKDVNCHRIAVRPPLNRLESYKYRDFLILNKSMDMALLLAMHYPAVLRRQDLDVVIDLNIAKSLLVKDGLIIKNYENLLGFYYHIIGRPDKAIECHMQAFYVNSNNNVESLLYLIYLLMINEQVNDVEMVQDFISDIPNCWIQSPFYYFIMAELDYLKGNRDGALWNLERSLQLDSKFIISLVKYNYHQKIIHHKNQQLKIESYNFTFWNVLFILLAYFIYKILNSIRAKKATPHATKITYSRRQRHAQNRHRSVKCPSKSSET